MGGWFNREINSLADLKGLKMRIPGLGGEVMQRASALPVILAGSEIFTALQTGAIDATEWVGPYNDMAFGLHQAARYRGSAGCAHLCVVPELHCRDRALARDIHAEQRAFRRRPLTKTLTFSRRYMHVDDN
jgi:hypothetical protein